MDFVDDVNDVNDTPRRSRQSDARTPSSSSKLAVVVSPRATAGPASPAGSARDTESVASMAKRKLPCHTIPRNEIPPIFQGSKAWFVNEDFDETMAGKLKADFEWLGGKVVDRLQEATYIIFYPPIARGAKWHEKLLALTNRLEPLTDPVPCLRPYTWIYESMWHYPEPRILQSGEIRQQPCLQQWDNEVNRLRPVKVYVSLNLQRYEDEPTSEAMVEVVTRMLEVGGAVRSTTRGGADLLLLNLETETGQKYAESKKQHQSVESRDWLEDTLFEGRILVRGQVKRDEFMRQQRVSAGPGRPWLSTEPVAQRRPIKGGRSEFSPADDNRMARFLAYYDPLGSRWKSLTLYEQLEKAAQEDAHLKWALAHTPESWRERVRKRVAYFQNKVDQFTPAGLDHLLRTKNERLGLRAGTPEPPEENPYAARKKPRSAKPATAKRKREENRAVDAARADDELASEDGQVSEETPAATPKRQRVTRSMKQSQQATDDQIGVPDASQDGNAEPGDKFDEEGLANTEANDDEANVDVGPTDKLAAANRTDPDEAQAEQNRAEDEQDRTQEDMNGVGNGVLERGVLEPDAGLVVDHELRNVFEDVIDAATGLDGGFDVLGGHEPPHSPVNQIVAQGVTVAELMNVAGAQGDETSDVNVGTAAIAELQRDLDGFDDDIDDADSSSSDAEEDMLEAAGLRRQDSDTSERAVLNSLMGFGEDSMDDVAPDLEPETQAVVDQFLEGLGVEAVSPHERRRGRASEPARRAFDVARRPGRASTGGRRLEAFEEDEDDQEEEEEDDYEPQRQGFPVQMTGVFIPDTSTVSVIDTRRTSRNRSGGHERVPSVDAPRHSQRNSSRNSSRNRASESGRNGVTSSPVLGDQRRGRQGRAGLAERQLQATVSDPAIFTAPAKTGHATMLPSSTERSAGNVSAHKTSDRAERARKLQLGFADLIKRYALPHAEIPRLVGEYVQKTGRRPTIKQLEEEIVKSRS